MKVTEILMAEHQTILKELKDLEQHLGLASPSKERILKSIDFIREYADEFHHAKEEDIYFKWMIDKNPGFKDGPIRQMLFEHDQGRELVTKAKKSLEDTTLDEDKQFELAKLNLLEFIELLREHIQKEDSILYQMAERTNSFHHDGDELMMPLFNKVNEKFKKIETNDSCCGSCH